MTVNINFRITPFGQVVFEIGKPTLPVEANPVVPLREEPRYREPLETASRIFEVQYQEELTNYFVLPSTA